MFEVIYCERNGLLEIQLAGLSCAWHLEKLVNSSIREHKYPRDKRLDA
jgi:hypothetical protein